MLAFTAPPICKAQFLLAQLTTLQTRGGGRDAWRSVAVLLDLLVLPCPEVPPSPLLLQGCVVHFQNGGAELPSPMQKQPGAVRAQDSASNMQQALCSCTSASAANTTFLTWKHWLKQFQALIFFSPPSLPMTLRA